MVEKGAIVAASDQHRKDIEQAFYVGWYAAMGLIAKMNKLPHDDAVALAQNMINECKHVIMPKSVKFTSSIDGKPINNN